MPIEGFVHISQLGWGYYDYDPAKQTMTSYEEMTEVRIGDRVTVKLESVDLESRRINFMLQSNHNRRRPSGGGGSRRARGRSGGFDGWYGAPNYFEDDDDEDWD